MKTYMLLPLLATLFCVFPAFAQFQTGNTTITFNDPSRSTTGFGSGGGPGRQIQCEIYYPALSAGANTPVAAGTFPVVVFGHGFVMAWDAYQNIWEHYVPKGYIMVFPRTEGGVNVSHSEFAKDLLIAASRMQAASADASSLFYNHWNGKKAVVGHSMGGGASFLAAGEVTSSFDAVVGMAPAETTPSAAAAAAGIAAPSLVFSGTGDAVTPPADHHIPIYNGIPASACKQFISVTGGAHCYFANSNFACDFGESSSGGSVTITRAQQQSVLFDLLDPWLSFYLQGNCSDWTVFSGLLSTDGRISGQNDCSYVLPAAPVITQNGSVLSTPAGPPLQWYLNGSILQGQTGSTLETSSYGDGSYTVSVTDMKGCEAVSAPLVIGNGTASLSTIPGAVASVYPNPASGIVSVSLHGQLSAEVALMSAQGQLIEKRRIDGTASWHIGNLEAGTYFFMTENGAPVFFVKH